MISQQRDLETALSEAGWRINDKASDTNLWWVDELWTLESAQSPVGTCAFLVFVVDPQWDGPRPRKKGKGVWAVSVARTDPRALEGPFSVPSVPLRPHWDSACRAITDLS